MELLKEEHLNFTDFFTYIFYILLVSLYLVCTRKILQVICVLKFGRDEYKNVCLYI